MNNNDGGTTVIDESNGNEGEEPVVDPFNGYEYVDLGLSVLWATTNIGANSPEEYGAYFAFGETSTKSEYLTTNLTYTEIPSTILPDTADAAHVNWGGVWRMPTVDDYHELKNYCDISWTTDYLGNGTNIQGHIVTGRGEYSGNSIFLPAAGYISGKNFKYKDSRGYYRLSTSQDVTETSVAYLFFYSGSFVLSVGGREAGMSIRAVASKQE